MNGSGRGGGGGVKVGASKTGTGNRIRNVKEPGSGAGEDGCVNHVVE